MTALPNTQCQMAALPLAQGYKAIIPIGPEVQQPDALMVFTSER